MNCLEQCLSYWSQERALGAQLCEDSRLIRPGDVFVAYPGERVDGRDFISQALAQGAVGIIAEPGKGVSERLMGVKHFLYPDCRQEVSPLVYAWYGVPSQKMRLVAVTGTNGKTSCCHWMSQLLTQLGARPAVIGTLGSGYGRQWTSSVLTTPKAAELAPQLRTFAEAGCSDVIFEASSIGLAEARLKGLRIDAALYTNCTHDHLDYHGTMAAYAEAKAQLFRYTSLKQASLYAGDALSAYLQSLLSEDCQLCCYDLTAIESRSASHLLWASQVQCTQTGIHCLLHTKKAVFPAFLPILGRFNLKNILAVMGLLLIDGHSLPELIAAAQVLSAPEGRMNCLSSSGDPRVYIDYAHTPDALETVLAFLREMTGSRIHVVFGAGGHRDQDKRPLMGAVVARYASDVYVTSDNPRDESPEHIIAEIVAGIPEGVAYTVCPDRAEAIHEAIMAAQVCDIVLIAGKGHESYQEYATGRVPFSDRAVAMSALRKRKLR